MDMEIRAISKKHSSKISIVDLSESIDEIIKLQKTNPLCSVALGRTIINTTLVSLSLKDGGKITVNINGMGLGGTVIAEFQNNSVRGYIEKPDFKINEISQDEKFGSPLSQVVGKKGFLQLSRYNDNVEPYTSKVELISGEINFDFMYYLQQSDQINSLILSTVEINDDGSIKKACGIMIQLMPGFKDEDIDFLEEKIGSTEYLIKTLIQSTNYEALIKNICEDANILGASELKFECTCNEEKVMNSIKMLDKDEILKVIEKEETMEVVCDFCKKFFYIDFNKLKELIL